MDWLLESKARKEEERRGLRERRKGDGREKDGKEGLRLGLFGLGRREPWRKVAGWWWEGPSIGRDDDGLTGVRKEARGYLCG